MNKRQAEQLLSNRESKFELNLAGGFYLELEIEDTVVFKDDGINIYGANNKAVRISYSEVVSIIAIFNN